MKRTGTSDRRRVAEFFIRGGMSWREGRRPPWFRFGNSGLGYSAERTGPDTKRNNLSVGICGAHQLLCFKPSDDFDLNSFPYAIPYTLNISTEYDSCSAKYECYTKREPPWPPPTK